MFSPGKRGIDLRYPLAINVLVAFAPAMVVKGRDHDPLRNVSWWTLDQHSAVLIVLIAAAVSVAASWWVMKRTQRRWWSFVACGLLAGLLPAMFYLVLAPRDDFPAPQLAAMLLNGGFWGIIGGFAQSWIMKPAQRPAAS